jgi:hypothetical protein
MVFVFNGTIWYSWGLRTKVCTLNSLLVRRKTPLKLRSWESKLFRSLFNDFINNSAYVVLNNLMTVNNKLERMWKERSCPSLKQYPDISQEELRKITRNRSQDSRGSGRDTNTSQKRYWLIQLARCTNRVMWYNPPWRNVISRKQIRFRFESLDMFKVPLSRPRTKQTINKLKFLLFLETVLRQRTLPMSVSSRSTALVTGSAQPLAIRIPFEAWK